MTPSRWQRIETLFHAALERTEGERTAFLDLACGADDELRHEVQSLLTARSSPLDKAPVEDVPVSPDCAVLKLQAGMQLGPYHIDGQLGAGGMGEVYAATDRRLGRAVAIKVSNERIDGRFEREARAISALNHPHICTLYDVGPNYLVMELVEGETLAVRIKRGPLSMEQTVEYGLQLADALAAAHSKGITHRDLKPGNIMLAQSGVKVLDFGLAKSTGDETLTGTHTALGTPAYMAPEQREGKDCDARSDIYALGLVLCEMMTGKRLPSDKPTLPGGLPPKIAKIIERCVRKDSADRWESALDVRKELLSAGSLGWGWAKAVAAVAAMAALLVTASLFWRTWSNRPAESIAVLPFVNASGNPEMEYLSDGITESLINALAQVPNLVVMSRNAVFRYKGREADAQAAGQALKVQAVLTGRMMQRGDSLSISAELIEVRNNQHLWGEQYNRQMRDLMAVQEEISSEISERLRFRLTGEEKRRLTKRYTENTMAYRLYLQGRYHWNKKTPDGFNKGAEYFQKAIDADPNYAPAYAGLAALYNNQANYNFALVPPQQAWSKAKGAAERAVQIDDSLAAAHSSLALVAYQWAWDWATAEKEFKRSLELDSSSVSTYEPNPSSTNHWYSHYLMSMRRNEESFRAGRRALELDPLDLANVSHQGWFYLFDRQYDRAVEPLRQTIEMNPNFSIGHWYLGVDYEQQGAFQEAIAEFEAAVRVTQGNPSMIALLGYGYAAAQQRTEAVAILQQLAELSKKRYVPPYPIAAIYAALGKKDDAFAWLEKAYSQHDSWMDYLGTDPRLDGLRTDPRFGELLRRMNLGIGVP